MFDSINWETPTYYQNFKITFAHNHVPTINPSYTKINTMFAGHIFTYTLTVNTDTEGDTLHGDFTLLDETKAVITPVPTWFSFKNNTMPKPTFTFNDPPQPDVGATFVYYI